MKDNERETLIPPLSFDEDKYRGHLEEMTLTAEQESELLAILWDIMSTMVDIGFGEHSVQRVMDTLIINASTETEDLVEIKQSSIITTQESAHE